MRDVTPETSQVEFVVSLGLPAIANPVLLTFPVNTLGARPGCKPKLKVSLLLFFSLTDVISARLCAAATGAPGSEAPAGAAGAPEEDGEPPSGAGAGEAAAGAEAAAAQEQGAGPRK